MHRCPHTLTVTIILHQRPLIQAAQVVPSTRRQHFMISPPPPPRPVGPCGRYRQGWLPPQGLRDLPFGGHKPTPLSILRHIWNSRFGRRNFQSYCFTVGGSLGPPGVSILRHICTFPKESPRAPRRTPAGPRLAGPARQARCTEFKPRTQWLSRVEQARAGHLSRRSSHADGTTTGALTKRL